MTLRTDTYDPERWQLVPKEMTHKMRGVVWMGDGDWRELLDTAPEPPAQQPTRDLLAEATEQVEALERENHRMRRCVARLMARLTVWLDDDQFNEADGIVHPEFEPPAQQPMTEDEIYEETRAATDALMDYIYEYGTGAEGSQQFIRRIARAVEAHHGIGKGESK